MSSFENEQWKIRDNSWAPTSTQCPEDTVGPEAYGKHAVLVKRPVEFFTNDCFEFRYKELPSIQDFELKPDTVLIQNIYLSMDPTHIIWSKLVPQYMPAVGLQTTFRCITIFKIIKSSDEIKFPIHSIYSGVTGICEYAMIPCSSCIPIQNDVPITWNIGPLSIIQGHTAWIGYKICNPKLGETIVISGAHGSVGSTAGQLAKSTGARVIGIAGGKEKCKAVIEDFKFDDCIDYKNDNVQLELQRLCPNGIDSYFDNVGGEILDTILLQMNCFGRIAICGSISQYNNLGEYAKGIKNFEIILMRRLIIQGYVGFDHIPSMNDGYSEIKKLIINNQFVQKEDIREVSIENYVDVINDLYYGRNCGKLIIKLI